jgi:pyruvate/2-oxoglutarate/acetoin dehydrogenase E1 component
MCLKAAEDLFSESINVRVVDLRTVKPIDWETIGRAAQDCARVLVVSEDRYHGGVGPTLAAYINEHLFEHLDAPVKILHAQDARVAYGKDGDEICLPTMDEIKQAARDLIEY